MKKSIFLFLWTLIFCVQSFSLSSKQELFKNFQDSVVHIYSKTANDNQKSMFAYDPFFKTFFDEKLLPNDIKDLKRSLGTGVIVTADGYIVTSSHVVENNSEILVKLSSDLSRDIPVRIVGIDVENDIALLKIEENGLKKVTLEDSSSLELGDTLYAIGEPYGIGAWITEGMLSFIQKEKQSYGESDKYLIMDINNHPGFSGGAIVNIKGRVVGLYDALLSKKSGVSGFGVAKASNLVRKSMTKLMTREHNEPVWFGISIKDLNKETSDFYRRDKGVVVVSVDKNSPASKAGIQRGDLIIAIDNTVVLDKTELSHRMALMRPDDLILIESIRDHVLKETVVKLTKPFGEIEGLSDGINVEGITIEPLTRKLRESLAADVELTGIVITNVKQNSYAQVSGLIEGDIVLQVDDNEINSIDTFKKSLKKLPFQELTIYRKGIVRKISWKRE